MAVFGQVFWGQNYYVPLCGLAFGGLPENGPLKSNKMEAFKRHNIYYIYHYIIYHYIILLYITILYFPFLYYLLYRIILSHYFI
jgi:hypothetical protein